MTNTMFLAAPWADALYAIDAPWWKHYGEQVREVFRGLCYSMARYPGVRRGDFPAFRNSGAAALSLAANKGAERIVMVGYDCQRTGGQVHSHGDHPAGLGNAVSMPQWHGRFAECARYLARRRDLVVINASRETALTCFARGDLEDALC